MEKIIKKIKISDIIIATVLVLIGASFRLFPHFPNFTPIAAIALFAGVYLSKKIAILVPILAMIISDIFIGYYEPSLMISVYASFFICVLFGFWLKNHKKWHLFLGGSVMASLVFFLLTNFAVWIFTPWYAKTFFGLAQCYLMAIPFLRNTFLGDLSYVVIFFGTYEAVRILIERKFKSTRTVNGMYC